MFLGLVSINPSMLHNSDATVCFDWIQIGMISIFAAFYHYFSFIVNFLRFIMYVIYWCNLGQSTSEEPDGDDKFIFLVFSRKLTFYTDNPRLKTNNNYMNHNNNTYNSHTFAGGTRGIQLSSAAFSDLTRRSRFLSSYVFPSLFLSKDPNPDNSQT